MSLHNVRIRLQGFSQRRASKAFFRRPFVVASRRPVISFTFDDFPRSALFTGGAILRHYGATGSYYASLGLVETDTATGRIFAAADLSELVTQGHELGCHTFTHCDSWETPARTFERSVIDNRDALSV